MGPLRPTSDLCLVTCECALFPRRVDIRVASDSVASRPRDPIGLKSIRVNRNFAEIGSAQGVPSLRTAIAPSARDRIGSFGKSRTPDRTRSVHREAADSETVC